jgi:pimeloyl-ACP methyl ester carboxylesterase
MISTILAFGQDITGEWNAVLKVQGMQLRLVFHIMKTDSTYKATMDSPDQGAKDIPMSNVTFINKALTVEMEAAKINYTGILDNNGVVKGSFTQGGQSFPLNLTREKIEKEEIKDMEIINTAVKETKVILETKSGQIFGTLTTPNQFSKIPVALIIAGSGPTDRDGNGPMLKSNAYKKLAYGLAENNIASLRYDKRGIAESQAAMKKESDIRFDDYVNDAKEWIQLLKKDKRFSTVSIIGHSEGSLIGLLAAGKADKFISIAGAGQSIDKTLKEQLSAQPKEILELSNPIIESLKQGKTVDKVDPKVEMLFRPSVQPYLISWFKYDPQIEIRKVNIPILIVQGTNDIQVTVEDAKRLSKANPKAQLVMIDKMNHIFIPVEGDRQANIATYNNPAIPLAEGLVKKITDFIIKE